MHFFLSFLHFPICSHMGRGQYMHFWHLPLNFKNHFTNIQEKCPDDRPQKSDSLCEKISDPPDNWLNFIYVFSPPYRTKTTAPTAPNWVWLISTVGLRPVLTTIGRSSDAVVRHSVQISWSTWKRSSRRVIILISRPGRNCLQRLRFRRPGFR